MPRFAFEHKGGEWHVTFLVSDSCHVPQSAGTYFIGGFI